MKLAIDYLEPMLEKKNDGQEMPTLVIATVEGDIHDIGKNLVVLMLKNYGYNVIDMGKMCRVKISWIPRFVKMLRLSGCPR